MGEGWEYEWVKAGWNGSSSIISVGSWSSVWAEILSSPPCGLFCGQVTLPPCMVVSAPLDYLSGGVGFRRVQKQKLPGRPGPARHSIMSFAFRELKYFTELVQIQSERGLHKIVNLGRRGSFGAPSLQTSYHGGCTCP